jgi:tRNA threonylcarbamoyladenosine biosynthesis protein TsaE
MKIVVTKTETETKDFAMKTAKDILSLGNKKDQATVLALEGVLGAGKTTFAQGFSEGLEIKEAVKSPTYLIMKEYEIKIKNKESEKKNKIFSRFYHIDCYRLENEEDIGSIGLPEILKNPENLVLIEWAGKIKKALPKDCIKIRFYYISENKRKISIV